MSYKFKGAKGPWQAVDSEDSCLIHVGYVDDRGIMSAAICSLHGEREADLIAASYELFEAGNSALESLLFARQELRAQASIPDADEQQIQDAIDELRTVLAKATGESNE